MTQDSTAATKRRPAFPLALRRALPGLVLLAVAVRVLVPVRDPDTFWHLRAGDFLRQTWSFAGPEPWSPASSRPWVLHEWLPELVLSIVQQWLGLPGVAWLLPLGATAALLAVWASCRDRAPILVSAVVATVTFVAMAGSMSLRPQLVTFALTAVTVRAWLRTAEDRRPRGWLVPLTWLWACTHGMWFVGLVVAGTVIAGMALDRSLSWRQGRQLALVPALSLVAAALTPVGPGLLLAPLTVRGYTRFVTEWAAPSLSDGFFLAFLALAAVPVLLWARGGTAVPWTRLLLLAAGTGMALLYVRTVPLGAAVVAPVTAEALARASRLRREDVSPRETRATAVLAAVGLAIAAVLAPTVAAHPGRGPAGLDVALDALATGTVVCNDYTDGGWLLWRHPQLRPVIDGRTEVYSVDHVERYTDFVAARPGWQAFPQRTGCTHALLPDGSPVLESLRAQEHWTQVARADGSTLLRSPSS
ncbi:MAG TPA: hypothetical protein VFJ94_15970 [Intrasporangium sp.]|uniref:hypothetical protein n=1 Tax=Intrasporangium sp. TaxID=1925024 RepID=UPI002D7910ED|nr:hypothetical protein [Intrasporangium sp.]HET7400013.1 hypothetical protein [Intrasporangium sp.]